MTTENKRLRYMYSESEGEVEGMTDDSCQSTKKIVKRRKIPKPDGLMVLSIITQEKNTSMILPYLYVGGYCGLQDEPYSLATHGIEFVVNCSDKSKPLPPPYSTPFTFYDVKLDDCPSCDLSEAISTVVPIIQNAKIKGKKCLIYCNIGMSRSVSLALAYLIVSEGMSLLKAMELMKTRRRIASPNPGFMMQLITLEKRMNEARGGFTTVDISKYRHDRFGDVSSFRQTNSTFAYVHNSNI
mmetsp:Transcript_43866/g.86041  ORF Transcript_43866/g.86041 Transcript_43866/m.86041 type:complete len:241 (-) Transcript_43866:28-750(-)